MFQEQGKALSGHSFRYRNPSAEGTTSPSSRCDYRLPGTAVARSTWTRPTSEPFLQQHRRVYDAVCLHGLPPAPQGSVAARQAVYDRGRTRAATLAATTPMEMETVAMSPGIILP